MLSPCWSAQLCPLQGEPKGHAGQTVVGVCTHKQVPVLSCCKCHSGDFPDGHITGI